MLILVRGVPGSGKTTYVEKCINGNYYYNYWCEADNYFVRADGVYDFNPKLLKNAHEYCYRLAAYFLELSEYSKREVVYVSNTFTRVWEMQKYIDFAKANNIPFKVVRCTGNYQNVHGVPDAKVKEMLARFEDYEGEEFV